MNPFAWLNPGRWLLCGALVAALVLGIYTLDKSRQAIGYDRAKAEQAVIDRAALENTRQAEQQAAEKLTAIQQKAINDKSALNRQLAVLTDSLRNRTERPVTDMPKSTANSVACTGSSLYAADARFLIGESARADQLRIDYEACKASYDAAVELTK